MKIETPVRWLWVIMAGVLVLGAPLPALAQGCALCYTQAASSTARFIHALRSGILILVIPPMFMSVAITVIAYRKRNQFKQSDGMESERNW